MRSKRSLSHSMWLYLVMEKEERAAWVMFDYKLMPEVRRVYAMTQLSWLGMLGHVYHLVNRSS